MRKFFPILYFLFILLNSAFAVEITLLYWGDRHAQNLPIIKDVAGESVRSGGAARLAGMVSRFRSFDPNTLVIVAGDEFTGTPVSTITKGRSEIDILNLIRPEVMVVGNHEFDYGWRSLANVTRGAKFQILLANVTIDSGEGLMFPEDTVLTAGGVVVGVIGLIYPDFTESVQREGILGISAWEPDLVTQSFISRRRDNCDLLVAATHMGWYLDSTLAAHHPQLDVIIGGHDHIPFDPPRVVNGVLIVHSTAQGTTLGRLVLDVDTLANRVRDFRGELLPVNESSAPEDKKVAKLVNRLEKKYASKLNRKIATLGTDWNASGREPSNLPQWAADVMLRAVRGEVSERVNLAVVNSENFRKDLKRGPLTERDMWEISPFESALLVVQLSGNELLRALQYQLDTPRDLLTWSGLRVEASDGRLDSVMVNGYQVQRSSEYTLVVSSYLWGNFESYFGLAQVDRPRFNVPGMMQRDVFIRAAEGQGYISTATDDRWNVR